MESLQFQASASIENLRKRAAILKTIRRFFDDAGFFEVQTPTLSRETMIDRHIDPIVVSSDAIKLALPDTAAADLYLQTSPEFAMKRLLASGADAIYQICPAFRAGERGRIHNPEFTILEWYRVGDSFREGVGLLSEFTKTLTGAPNVVQMTYQEAFLTFADVDPLNTDVDRLRQIALQSDPELRSLNFETADDWLDVIFDGLVSPELGKAEPLILTHYPKSQAALAQVSSSDPRTAERFELFINGIELANGYAELLNPEELLTRLCQNNLSRQADGKSPIPEPLLLYEAMKSGIPQCSGCALGVDRLIAIILGLAELSEVLTFPIDRA